VGSCGDSLASLTASWFVGRAHPTQIYFDSGFPHGSSQHVSAAMTNWVTLALVAR
jgi:hypothetical protein